MSFDGKFYVFASQMEHLHVYIVYLKAMYFEQVDATKMA